MASLLAILKSILLAIRGRKKTDRTDRILTTRELLQMLRGKK